MKLIISLGAAFLFLVPGIFANNHHNCDCHIGSVADNSLTIATCAFFPNVQYLDGNGQCYSSSGQIGGNEWEAECKYVALQGWTVNGKKNPPYHGDDVTGHCDH